MRVNLTYQTEYRGSLPLLRQDEQHLDILSRIESRGIHHGHSSIGIGIDTSAYLLILLRNNEELDASSATVHHLVDAKRLNAQHHITIKHLFYIMHHQITGRDDEDVAYHDDSSQGHIPILIHDSGDNIGTTRTTATRESQSDAASTEDSTKDCRPKRLVLQQVLLSQRGR